METTTVNPKTDAGRVSRLRVRVVRAPIVDSRELRLTLTARAKALVL